MPNLANTLQFLQDIPDLAQVPAAQLEWLIGQSELKELPVGGYMFQRGDPSDELMIMLSGRIRVFLDQKGETREMARLEAGDITGLLPYSRLKQALGFGQALEPSVYLSLHRHQFPEMIRNHYELTAALVHVMTNRVRNFTTLEQQNEKLLSLGKLSAGLAHELNNPAAAVVRSAIELKKHLAMEPVSFKKIMGIKMTDKQVDQVNDLLFTKAKAGMISGLSLLERTDREDELRDWLEDQEIEDDPELVETLVEYGFREADLDTILEYVGESSIGAVIGWMGNILTTEKMVNEIKEASQRISELVGSMKSYSYMDQTTDRQLVNLHDGIRNTVTMLRHKFKKYQVEWVEAFSPQMPQVPGFPGELNQVWTNLIDNALDALKDSGGNITVATEVDGPSAVVRVIDDGPGIPEEVLGHIFDPFFTTKSLGEGTGLGLDTVQKILRHHRAEVKVTSQAGHTEFQLWFPLK